MYNVILYTRQQEKKMFDAFINSQNGLAKIDAINCIFAHLKHQLQVWQTCEKKSQI